MSKLKELEMRINVIEEKLKPKEKKQYPKGTSSKLDNFILVVIFFWLLFPASILLVLCRFFKVMFMSREEQVTHKESYINGRFNPMEYVSGNCE